jgi:ABC-type amino acid transport substrate-binding protein
MKKYIFVSLLMSFSIPMLASAETVTVGVIEYPPHINVKGKVASGHAIDYLTKVLKSAGLDPVFTAYPSRRAMSEFDSGNIDVLLPINEGIDKGKKLTKPLFHVTPGLCFKKENFISILSANHRFKGVKVGYTDGTPYISDLTTGGANMSPIKGKDTLTRGIQMLKAGRYDAIYHPSPINVYNQESKDYDTVACSYFFGHSAKVFITTSSKAGAKYKAIDDAFSKSLSDKSYEFYFAENR